MYTEREEEDDDDSDMIHIPHFADTSSSSSLPSLSHCTEIGFTYFG